MPFRLLKKAARTPPGPAPGWAVLYVLFLLVFSCAAAPLFTEEELRERSLPAPDPELARLVKYTLAHGYDLTDPLEGRFRYIVLERTAKGVVDRRYFEVEITKEGPARVLFLLNTGRVEQTDISRFPEDARKDAERFVAREEARGAKAQPIAIEKRLMVKSVYPGEDGELMFSRGVVILEVSDIYEVAHENFTLFRFFGLKSREPGREEILAADGEFDAEVKRFLKAYREVMD